MANPYETLDVATNASQEDVRKAYRKAAKETHPDLNPGKPEAESASRRSMPPTTSSAMRTSASAMTPGRSTRRGSSANRSGTSTASTPRRPIRTDATATAKRRQGSAATKGPISITTSLPISSVAAVNH